MVRAPKNYPNVAAFAGLLRRLGAVNGASRMKVEARTPVQRAFSMPIERRGADAALRYGFRATRWVFEGAHTLLTPTTLLRHQSRSKPWRHRSMRTSSYLPEHCSTNLIARFCALTYRRSPNQRRPTAGRVRRAGCGFRRDWGSGGDPDRKSRAEIAARLEFALAAPQRGRRGSSAAFNEAYGSAFRLPQKKKSPVVASGGSLRFTG